MKKKLKAYHVHELALKEAALKSWQHPPIPDYDPDCTRKNVSACKGLVQFHKAVLAWLK